MTTTPLPWQPHGTPLPWLLYRADMKYEDLLAAGSIGSDRILMCQQRSTNCFDLPAFSQTPYFTRVNKSHNCIPTLITTTLFTIILFQENSITGTCFRINPMGTLNALMGDYGALQLRFWADVQDYSDSSKNNPYHGFTVAFHDRDSYGSTLSSGYLMSPGSYYKVDLRMRKVQDHGPWTVAWFYWFFGSVHKIWWIG